MRTLLVSTAIAPRMLRASKWSSVPPAGGASYRWSQHDSQSSPASSTSRQTARIRSTGMFC